MKFFFAFVTNLIFLTATIAQTVPNPSWWSQGDPPPIDPNITVATNKMPCNLGQAKWMVVSAFNALQSTHPQLAAQIKTDLVPIFDVDADLAALRTEEWKLKQKQPLLIGQLKALAKPFYDTLHTYDTPWLLAQLDRNQTRHPSDPTFLYPWKENKPANGTNNSIASIGQLKAVFALDFQSLPPEDPDADSDNDGYTNAEELLLGTNPYVPNPELRADSDNDGLEDGWEFLIIGASETDEFRTLSDVNPNNSPTGGNFGGFGPPRQIPGNTPPGGGSNTGTPAPDTFPENAFPTYAVLDLGIRETTGPLLVSDSGIVYSSIRNKALRWKDGEWKVTTKSSLASLDFSDVNSEGLAVGTGIEEVDLGSSPLTVAKGVIYNGNSVSVQSNGEVDFVSYTDREYVINYDKDGNRTGETTISSETRYVTMDQSFHHCTDAGRIYGKTKQIHTAPFIHENPDPMIGVHSNAPGEKIYQISYGARFNSANRATPVSPNTIEWTDFSIPCEGMPCKLSKYNGKRTEVRAISPNGSSRIEHTMETSNAIVNGDSNPNGPSCSRVVSTSNSEYTYRGNPVSVDLAVGIRSLNNGGVGITRKAFTLTGRSLHELLSLDSEEILVGLNNPKENERLEIYSTKGVFQQKRNPDTGALIPLSAGASAFAYKNYVELSNGLLDPGFEAKSSSRHQGLVVGTTSGNSVKFLFPVEIKADQDKKGPQGSAKKYKDSPSVGSATNLFSIWPNEEIILKVKMPTTLGQQYNLPANFIKWNVPDHVFGDNTLDARMKWGLNFFNASANTKEISITVGDLEFKVHVKVQGTGVLTEAEGAALVPHAAPVMLAHSFEAKNYTNTSFPLGPKRDAMRHAYWCSLSVSTFPVTAGDVPFISTGHEHDNRYKDKQQAFNSTMDLKNNNVGISVNRQVNGQPDKAAIKQELERLYAAGEMYIWEVPPGAGSASQGDSEGILIKSNGQRIR